MTNTERLIQLNNLVKIIQTFNASIFDGVWISANPYIEGVSSIEDLDEQIQNAYDSGKSKSDKSRAVITCLLGHALIISAAEKP